MLALDPTVWTWPSVVDASGGPSSVRPWSWSGGQVMEEFFPRPQSGPPGPACLDSNQGTCLDDAAEVLALRKVP